uniref:RING-type domain-containing protein n=1 Tax=Setaria italica TaxID=4555 RepID=K3ZA02_SETIT
MGARPRRRAAAPRHVRLLLPGGRRLPFPCRLARGDRGRRGGLRALRLRPRRYALGRARPYVDAAAKCRRFADVVSADRGGAIGVGTTMKEGGGSGAASHAAVLALPPAAGDGAPCAICREVMARGRGGVGVCALRPCGHRFHWRCALRWLAWRNTCPCCRAELPAQDAAAETRRLWRAVERMARGG